MNQENLTFTTARGSVIPLEYPIKFHTIFPELWSMNFTSIVKEDKRFDYIETVFKNINGYKIEYCKVNITDHVEYEDEEYIHREYHGKTCYLTLVTSNDENIKNNDLEPNRKQRTVIIPEKLNL